MNGKNNVPTALDEFRTRLANVTPCEILLTGAKVWAGSVNPKHSEHVPHANWIGTDIEGGPGVEIVSDLSTIDQQTGRKFDGVFSPATLEHIERPWCAVIAMANVLKPGGILFIHTHQTFPLHGYPSDHFRFSTEALRTMCFDAGLEVLAAGYDNPCTITPPPSVEVWNVAAEAFLNVNVCARKHD